MNASSCAVRAGTFYSPVPYTVRRHAGRQLQLESTFLCIKSLREFGDLIRRNLAAVEFGSPKVNFEILQRLEMKLKSERLT